MTTIAKLQEIEWLGDGSAYFRPPVMAHDAGYMMGAYEPKYPVPTTVTNAQDATNYLLLKLCPDFLYEVSSLPCKVCIEDFLDGLGESL